MHWQKVALSHPLDLLKNKKIKAWENIHLGTTGLWSSKRNIKRFLHAAVKCLKPEFFLGQLSTLHKHFRNASGCIFFVMWSFCRSCSTEYRIRFGFVQIKEFWLKTPNIKPLCYFWTDTVSRMQQLYFIGARLQRGCLWRNERLD